MSSCQSSDESYGGHASSSTVKRGDLCLDVPRDVSGAQAGDVSSLPAMANMTSSSHAVLSSSPIHTTSQEWDIAAHETSRIAGSLFPKGRIIIDEALMEPKLQSSSQILNLPSGGVLQSSLSDVENQGELMHPHIPIGSSPLQDTTPSVMLDTGDSESLCGSVIIHHTTSQTHSFVNTSGGRSSPVALGFHLPPLAYLRTAAEEDTAATGPSQPSSRVPSYRSSPSESTPASHVIRVHSQLNTLPSIRSHHSFHNAGPIHRAGAAAASTGAPLLPILESAAEGDGAGSSFLSAHHIGILERWWEMLMLMLMLGTMCTDAYMLAVLFSGGCSASLWAPALVFYLAPVVIMAILMVAYNAWMALSLHYFAIMIIQSDLNDLRQPWPHLDFLRYFMLFFTLCVLTMFGSVVVAMCSIMFAAVSLSCVPLLDTSLVVSTLASLTPDSLSGSFRQKDLLFIENYRCARLPIQALMHSLPQAVLMSYLLAAPGSTGCSSLPAPPIVASLVLACINFLGKLTYFLIQAKKQYGSRGLRMLTGVVELTKEALSFQGAFHVPSPVLERTLTRMLRSQSDLIVDHDLGEEEGEVNLDATNQPTSTLQNVGSSLHRQQSEPVALLPWCGVIPLVPHFLIPTKSGVLVPGQMTTLVQEAFHRFRRQGITSWALQYPHNGNRCLSNMVRDGLVHFRNLQYLTICKCKVVDRGFQDVASQVVSHPHLHTLRLVKVEMSSTAAGYLSELVREGSPLATFEVSACLVPPRATAKLARALRSNTRLHTFIYTLNGVNKYGAQAFADSVSVNQSLTHLDLSGNRMGPEGAASLTEGLSVCYNRRKQQQERLLEENLELPRGLNLVISICDVRLQGAKSLADAVLRLQEQVLGTQTLGDRGTTEAAAAAAVLRHQEQVFGTQTLGDRGTTEADAAAAAAAVLRHQEQVFGTQTLGDRGTTEAAGAVPPTRARTADPYHSQPPPSLPPAALGTADSYHPQPPPSLPPAALGTACAPEVGDTPRQSLQLRAKPTFTSNNGCYVEDHDRPPGPELSSSGAGTAAAAAAALDREPSVRGRASKHKRTQSEPSRLAAFAAAILGVGGSGNTVADEASSHALAAPVVTVVLPPCHIQIHDGMAGAVHAQGAPLSFVGGPGGTEALNAVTVGTSDSVSPSGTLHGSLVPSHLPSLTLMLPCHEHAFVDSVTAIFEVLQMRLTVMDLSGLGLGFKGAEDISKCITAGFMPVLEVLDLSANAIGDSGILALVDALISKPPPSLHTLDLSSNEVCDDGAEALAKLIKHREAVVAHCQQQCDRDECFTQNAMETNKDEGCLKEPSPTDPLEARWSSNSTAPRMAEIPSQGERHHASSTARTSLLDLFSRISRPALSMIPGLHGSAAVATPARALASAAAEAPSAPMLLPQLRIKLCDNHYPFGLEALRALQAAQQSCRTLGYHFTKAVEEAGTSCSDHVSLLAQAQVGSSVQGLGRPRPAVVIEMVRHNQQQHLQQQRTSPEMLRGGSFGRNMHGVNRETVMTQGADSGHHRRTTSHITDSSDPDTGCGVCMAAPNNLILKDCGHKLCVQCYRTLVRPESKKGASCPFCRASIVGFEYRGWPAFV
ncbi:hypothetical protein CEUSTIGMA_g1560.t1 [Chlamydomonas eustigma]|uniref:RING-type domain-containing protein n=1 Tax=Chlamydomonas eustigma TaxID=1157962 RepID=A0A250WTH1_9CHLO|nr:hypothetical protein CEUSTIGMA_g1560.t1 [Chlamydomonas eustigma]|eukprot:GAX74111.1 hypothetical protein CEUSTIGMA_g1560.t1 [Chlamydomonas eustigma]